MEDIRKIVTLVLGNDFTLALEFTICYFVDKFVREGSCESKHLYLMGCQELWRRWQRGVDSVVAFNCGGEFDGWPYGL